jgi:hypothetical protein
MAEFTVKEQGVNLSKNILGWYYVELHGLQRDDSGKVVDDIYLNIDVDGEELYLEHHGEEHLFDSLQDLADFLRFKYNTHLEAGAYFYLKLMLKTELNYTGE